MGRKKHGAFDNYKKIVILSCLAVALIAAAAIATRFLTYGANAKSAAEFRAAANQYLESGDKSANPINIRYGKAFYYYVPIQVNGKISLEFPGIMLDNKANPVTNELILKELFKYPALVMEFATTFKKFDAAAKSKTTAVRQYCGIVTREKIKLGEIVYSGNVVGVLYQGTKLSFDAVSLVKNVPAGLAALVKDLAKSEVQDAIVSYFVPADSRAALDAAQKAYDSAEKAAKACAGLTDAWNVMHSTSGKIETLKAALAVHNLSAVFSNEAEAMANLRDALDKVNNYPTLITKISKKDYAAGMAALDKLIEKLEAERDYWQARDVSVVSNAETWKDEQLRRIAPKPVATESKADTPIFQTPASPPSPVTSILNLSDDYSTYTYSKLANSCSSYKNNISSSQVSLRCGNSSAHWRVHWVKKINVSGFDKLQVKADLVLDDHTSFFSECDGHGVKYDNYVDLIIVNSDPNATLSAECNRVVSDADWPKCAVNYIHPTAITHCGVPKCGTSKSCDFEVDVAGRDAVYLVFYTTDPWLADIEGTLSNAKITLMSK
ncbi:hypothetical protein EPN28_01780 [Patescibacteria group bacterium]|nr:MAG: hypothetical protein EPN28_01780 [Patescibacteria group bacterium]